MTINSGRFLLFLFVVWAVWRMLPKGAAPRILLAASVFFYASSNLRHLGVILLVAGFNYATVQKLTAWTVGRKRDLLFSLAVALDIGLLLFYKWGAIYLDPRATPAALRDVLPASGANRVAFPLGLSFFIFQMVSCVTDVYRRKYQWVSGAGSFFLFALFFPQISAGPIPRASVLVPQLTSPRRLAPGDLEAGVSLFAYGLFKKLVVANRLQVYVDHLFSYHDMPKSTIPVLLAFVFNGLRLYTDFSGYTDMARGAARLFGIDLAENFNHPFRAESVTDFWQRWHMTLSHWLRDYLYKPIVFRLRRLGNNTAVGISVVFTFLVCGLWHQLSWPFAVFGLLHGTALCLEFLTRQSRYVWVKKWPWLGTCWVGRSYVFAFFVLTGVLFRANSLSQAWEFYGKVVVPTLPASLPDLFAYSDPPLFFLNFVALGLWGVVAAVRPKWAEHYCAWFVLLCAMNILVFGTGGGREFTYVAF
jgi:D-alanyl-lipoteichoic acid acyltransferase DltB (MBOAT superfamily)